MVAVPLGGKDGLMVQLAIRCHPCVPLSVDELERWLEEKVNELRSEAPHGTIRLSRLTQGLPSIELDIGWLVELELAEGEPLLAGDRLVEAVRDMRLIGLQPTLMTPAVRHAQSTDRPGVSRGNGVAP